MNKRKMLQGEEREKLTNELYKKYAGSQDFRQRLVYWRKKYTWGFIVGSTKVVKRVADVVISLTLLICLSPLLLSIALLIKFSDGGSVLHVTERVGKYGKEFRFPKFRSMVIDADSMKEALEAFNESDDKIIFKIKKDPRITRIGRFLRKSSLDELPQLWCVLKGDMSLVGPRPPLPNEVALYTLEQRSRLDVVPGLTCIWQVSGRSDIPFNRQVQLDKEYIESQSVWVDIKILLKTIPAIFFGRGAY